MKKLFSNRYAVVCLTIVLFIAIAAATRLVLFISTKNASLSVGQFTASMLIGFLYDLAVSFFVAIPFVLHLWWQNDRIYTRRFLPVVSGGFLVLIGLLLFTNIVPKDFNSQLHLALVLYIVLRFVIYLVLYLLPVGRRLAWRKGVLFFSVGLVVFLLLFNAVSEWFFWQEFSTRYNFIAVDYLVYTTEVLGNIAESYPIAWIIAAVLLLTVGVMYLVRRPLRNSVNYKMPAGKRTLWAVSLLLMPVLCVWGLRESWRHFSRNEYANSLAGNGLFEFAHAFGQNELDFYAFYRTMPDSAAFHIVRQQLQAPYSRFTSNDPFSIERDIVYPEPERKLNVVLISVESLSGSFMKAFGSKDNITPFLDSLAQHSLFFTNLYASGTRTVRGLEALSLSIPPTPGQSIVKRPDNGHLFSLGSVLRSKGYTTQYLYGGYSYFDNMKGFFGNNGYTVIDRTAIAPQDVHYQNIWGVADEDLFTLAIKVLDSNNASGKPFFSHIMTVSNHRPYTYPDGRIDIPAARQIREGAVKYTDYSINKFLVEARSKPWFDSTVFVIVSDHCAGSAGSVELPVTGYHIPMLIYAPKLLVPQQITALTAQMDVAPTILGLLNLQYRSKFFGQDALRTPAGQQRAFISTYQGLGYMRDSQLVIQSPVKTVRGFQPDFTTGDAVAKVVPDSLTQQAIAYYQSISWLLKHKKQTE